MWEIEAVILTKAKTLKGINDAIIREFGTDDFCYDSLESFNKAKREGWIEQRKNSLIFWYEKY